MRIERTLSLARSIFVSSAIWFVINFPSAHLRDIYIWHHHTEGAKGLQPQLVDAYIRKAGCQTALFSLLAPILIWVIGRLVPRTNWGFRSLLLFGPIIGLITGEIAYSQLNSDFLAITNVKLGDAGFLYSAIVSGVVVGEACRRYYLPLTGMQAIGNTLRQRFLVSTLMTWVVLLKILESLYLASLPLNRDPFGIHAFMFASVLLWTPVFCKFLWRFTPSGFLQTAILTVGAGIVLPYLVSWVLTYPVVISLYAGMTPSIYGMLWGRMLLKVSGTKSFVAVIFILPGLLWGVIVATLWRGFLAAEKADRPDSNRLRTL